VRYQETRKLVDSFSSLTLEDTTAMPGIGLYYIVLYCIILYYMISCVLLCCIMLYII